MRSLRGIALECVGAGLFVAGLALLWSPSDPLLPGLGFHPAWLGILVFAARYGTRGLLCSLAGVWGAVAALVWFVHGSPEALIQHASTAEFIIALVASILVAWVGMMHQTGRDQLEGRLESLSERAGDHLDETATLRQTVGMMRSRQERIDLSISFWRSVAARIERANAREAARASLDLVITRSGAQAAVAGRFHNGSFKELAVHGTCCVSDRTVAAAGDRGEAVLAHEVQDVRPEDSDIAVPILHPDSDEVVGVLAVRGVARSRVPGEVGELELIASWLAPALTCASRRATTAEPVSLKPAAAVAKGKRISILRRARSERRVAPDGQPRKRSAVWG